MTENHDKLRALYDAADASPGVPQTLGRIVICDDCDLDWTDRTESGGLITGSYAHCPNCEDRVRAALLKYNEAWTIRAECAPGQSFADFVRASRGPDSAITVFKR